MVNGTTRVYGVLGNPVAHSFSPLIHNTLADAMRLNLVYVPLGVSDPSRIGDAIRGAEAMGFGGMNVTVPYKSAVIPYLADIDPVAKAIGAVNTLVPVVQVSSSGQVQADRQNGEAASAGSIPEKGNSENNKGPASGFKGYNTDYLGLRRALEEMGIDLSAMDVVLIGAGGAARAAGFMSADAGVSHLTILNRTLSKAQSLADAIAAEFPSITVRAFPVTEAVRAVRDGWNTRPILAIQCTNVGLAPDTLSVPIQAPEFYSSISAAYDCIYNPEETRFISLCHKAGIPGRNGMDMLLWQGVIAFTLWTGKEPEKDLIEEVRVRLNHFIHG